VSDAWKMRAAVYGLLVVAAALVLGNRSPTHHRHTLEGSTTRGGQVRVDLDGRQVKSLAVGDVPVGCTIGYLRWTPVSEQRNVRVRETGSGFSVHESPDPAFNTPGLRQNAWMQGRLNWDAHRIEGVIRYFETGARGNCASGPIRFTAIR
jgi:hypothetical protein